MSVEFNDESNQISQRRSSENNRPPKLVTWLLKIGVAKNESQANYVLIGVAIVAFILSFYLWGGFLVPAKKFQGPTLEEILKVSQSPTQQQQ